jgi:hypothetical protein
MPLFAQPFQMFLLKPARISKPASQLPGSLETEQAKSLLQSAFEQNATTAKKFP